MICPVIFLQQSLRSHFFNIKIKIINKFVLYIAYFCQLYILWLPISMDKWTSLHAVWHTQWEVHKFWIWNLNKVFRNHTLPFFWHFLKLICKLLILKGTIKGAMHQCKFFKILFSAKMVFLCLLRDVKMAWGSP